MGHFLLEQAVSLPGEARLRDSDSFDETDIAYKTKTLAAPGDDDDYSGFTRIWSSWESLFY